MGLSEKIQYAGSGNIKTVIVDDVVKVQTCYEWDIFPNCGRIIVTFSGVNKCPGIIGTNKDWPSDVNTTFVLSHLCSNGTYCKQLFKCVSGGWTILACVLESIGPYDNYLYICAFYDCPGCSGPDNLGVAFGGFFFPTNCGNALGLPEGECEISVGAVYPTCSTYKYTEYTGYGGTVHWDYDTIGC